MTTIATSAQEIASQVVTVTDERLADGTLQERIECSCGFGSHGRCWHVRAYWEELGNR